MERKESIRIHVTTEQDSALGKEIPTRSTTWMNLEDRILSEISRTEKDEYCVILAHTQTRNSPAPSSRERKSGFQEAGAEEGTGRHGPKDTKFQLCQSEWAPEISTEPCEYN